MNAFFRLASCLLVVAGVISLSPAARGGVVTNANGTLSVTNPPATVTLAWDASADPRVVGYHVFWGAVSRQYSNVVAVPNTNLVTITNLVRGVTNFFAATAFTTNIESDFSAEVTYTAPALPSPPTGTHTAYFTVQSTLDLNHWSDLTDFALPVADDRGLFRLRIVAVR